ncbi:hypothetical protein THAOC_37552 [Thalassiosira oceanica]|uniref:MYND-type domain-containing protein n=1 Tax=Thalassiosira oceanica TaxID=159749 RepID=K0QZY4_THAOC|nr:hypothetical protein THAOC_37552 [Thalassiosira oceanica]|eukprot:EJK43954.1 hypothetical protein THAOC_37552 [Thalassiosira oceanica]
MSDETPNPSTGPKAGHGGEQKRTDEERLLDEIAKQKELIDAPPDDAKERIIRRANEKKLGQLEFKYQLMVEKKRLACELLKFQELYGDLYSEPCLICLDDIRVHASANLIEWFNCCGGFICKSCARDVREPGVGTSVDRCPLCRESLHAKTTAEKKAQVMSLAKRGVIWAQSNVGWCMTLGMRGFEIQVQTGMEWINKAAAQNYPAALYALSILYREGIASELERSQGRANELLLEAANLGHVLANSDLADCHQKGADGFEKNPDEFYFRASVAFALDNTHEEAARILGGLHFNKNQILAEPSPYLACYYRNIAASEDTTGSASYFYSKSLLRLAYNDRKTLKGSNELPAAFFWLRKSRDMGCNVAREMLKKWEIFAQKTCGNCGKKVQADEKFKQCSKCKAQWYCSKECQIEAWRAGHKQDCKRATILKFEDYLNAE